MIEVSEIKKDISGVSIPDDVARFQEAGILDVLLKDRTTDRNIIWATNANEHLGEGFKKLDEITPEKITGSNADIIRRRAVKDKNEKTALTRQHAEVFTPARIVKMMVDVADKAWSESLKEKERPDEWQDYVTSNRL